MLAPAKYRITPSILNKFQQLLDYELEFEGPYNRDSEGNYKLSADEIAIKIEKELIDSINRVNQEPSEAADKGTVFNEIIDRLILHQKDGNPLIEIHSSKEFEGLEIPCIYGSKGDFRFAFALDTCLSVAQKYSDAVPQYLCSCILPTKYGDVELYGYADYIQKDRVIDLKTTRMYSFPKFEKGWQKDLYPFCLVESGDMPNVSEFEYSIVLWKDISGEPTSGAFYSEAYTYNHERTRIRLTNMVTQFIEWLEINRELITDRKIFGGEEH